MKQSGVNFIVAHEIKSFAIQGLRVHRTYMIRASNDSSYEGVEVHVCSGGQIWEQKRARLWCGAKHLDLDLK